MRPRGGFQLHRNGTTWKEPRTVLQHLQQTTFLEDCADDRRSDHRDSPVLPLQELCSSRRESIQLPHGPRQEESQGLHDRLLYYEKVSRPKDIRAHSTKVVWL